MQVLIKAVPESEFCVFFKMKQDQNFLLQIELNGEDP